MDGAPAALLDAALRGALVALLVLLAGLLSRDRPHRANRWISLALLVGLAVQVVGSTPLLEARVALVWRAPLIAVSIGNGVLFWLFVTALVDDDFVLRPWHGAVWLAVVAYVGFVTGIAAPGRWPATDALFMLQRALPPVFALLAAVTAGLNWRADLVEPRRRLRAFVIVAGVGYALVMVAVRARSPHGQLAGPTAALDVGFLLLIVAVVAVRLLRGGDPDLLLFDAPTQPRSLAELARPQPPGPVPAPSVAAPLPADPVDQRLVEALQHAMAEERAYRTEDLTVAVLAARLGVPEYRLRRVINQRLGHRNFNAFVNGFRLDEARAALADAAKRELPILTIALDAGFQSIGPFNRAFKAATGLTPGEYRREKLADS